MFHFAIEKDNPVVYLAIKGQQSDDHSGGYEMVVGFVESRAGRPTTIAAADT